MTKLQYVSLTIKRVLSNAKELFLVAKYNAHRIFWKEKTDSVQVFIAMSSFLWATLLLWPGNSFVNPAYHVMAHFGPEEVWAFLFLIQGIAAATRVLLQCSCMGLLISDLVLGCILWTGASLSVLISVDPLSSGIASALISAWFSWWLLLRLPLDK